MTEHAGPRSLPDLASIGGGAAPLAEMYRALVEEIPAILYINGPEEHSPTLFVSPQTTDILGLPPEGWYDNTWSRHVHPEDRDAVQENYVRALRHGATDVDEYRFVRPDGEIVWLHDTIRVIRDEHGDPALVQGIMFDITARKRNEELLARQAQSMERIAAIGQRFTELLLAGGDLQAILDALATIAGAPVAFDDAARQLVGFATAGLDSNALLTTWETHSRRVHAESAAAGCAWAPVRLRDEEWGRLHLLAEEDADEIDLLALDRAAAAIGVWLLSNRDRTALADRARGEFIADLRQGRRWSAQDAVARSRTLGGDLASPVLLGIAVELVADRAAAQGARDPGSERALTAVQDQLRRLAAEAGTTCMAAVVGSVCLAIVGLSSDARARSDAGRLAARLRSSVQEELQRSISVGVSRPGSAEALRRALTEAVDAAAHGARTLRAGGVYHSADLGLRHLLARLGDGPELGRFVEDELGPLLEHDATGKVPLLPTLRAYLDSGGQKATAARMLHLERRSLYYRLERIEALLEADLDDPSTRLRAQVALQSLDVLRQRNAAYTL